MNPSTPHPDTPIPELIDRLGHADRLDRVTRPSAWCRLGRQGASWWNR